MQIFSPCVRVLAMLSEKSKKVHVEDRRAFFFALSRGEGLGPRACVKIVFCGWNLAWRPVLVWKNHQGRFRLEFFDWESALGWRSPEGGGGRLRRQDFAAPAQAVLASSGLGL